MKKTLSILLICMLVLSSVPAMAAKDTAADAGTKYTMAVAGTVLQNAPDRNITPAADALADNPVIEGESPTTGLPSSGAGRYMPMLVQISNPEDKKIGMAGVGQRAPWSGQYADIVYEGILYRSGQTRVTFLFNDSFDEGQPTNVGPIRSARTGHVLLREEWQGGIVFFGGPNAEENDITQMFAELNAGEKGVVFDLKSKAALQPYWERVEGVTALEAVGANLVALRDTIPTTTVATPHPFLFTDESPYIDGYASAYGINLDWGHKKYVSHFKYDEANNLYLRYSGDSPYMTFAGAYDRSQENMQRMAFSNVIIQRVTYNYANNSKIMPQMNSVGKGNADIFIGGRYIPGYWVRESISSPTVFFDDKGNELQLMRGKTFIGHFGPERLLTFE